MFCTTPEKLWKSQTHAADMPPGRYQLTLYAPGAIVAVLRNQETEQCPVVPEVETHWPWDFLPATLILSRSQ